MLMLAKCGMDKFKMTAIATDQAGACVGGPVKENGFINTVPNRPTN
jgi:hypothetical protein